MTENDFNQLSKPLKDGILFIYNEDHLNEFVLESCSVTQKKKQLFNVDNNPHEIDQYDFIGPYASFLLDIPRSMFKLKSVSGKSVLELPGIVIKVEFGSIDNNLTKVSIYDITSLSQECVDLLVSNIVDEIFAYSINLSLASISRQMKELDSDDLRAYFASHLMRALESDPVISSVLEQPKSKKFGAS